MLGQVIFVCSVLLAHLMPGDDFGQADALENWNQIVACIHVKHLILCALPLTVAKLWIVSFIWDWTHRVLSLLEDPPIEETLALN